MRLTTKGRYAVTAVLDLAFHQQSGPVSLADISERQAISLSYLEQLFSKLRKSNIVSSTRGPGGGYKLSTVPENISIVKIIIAVDESYRANGCESDGEYCQGGPRCLTHDLWDELSSQIHGFLDGISLADLMAHKDTLETACNQDETLDIRKLSEQVA
ncbi:MAG: Rrf2 family transcriptional regulator [Gammaproteobacteria bacterium]|nr:Rrf2 family transcriptional regulator [Gammaproteobacteria bacterium]